jgi:hypothetical protein
MKNYELKEEKLIVSSKINGEELKDLRELILEKSSSIISIELNVEDRIEDLNIYTLLKSVKKTFENISIKVKKETQTENLRDLKIVNF